MRRCIYCVMACYASLACHGADITVFGAASDRQIDDAAKFYGLTVQYIDVRDSRVRDVKRLEPLIDRNSGAVIVQAATLAHLDRRIVLDAVARKVRHHPPLLVFGISTEVDEDALFKWSDGVVTSCELSKPAPRFVRFVGPRRVTKELEGHDIPESVEGCSLRFSPKGRAASEVITAGGKEGSNATFVEIQAGGWDLFLASRITTAVRMNGGEALSRVFAEYASLLLYLRYCMGDRAWHTPGHYANLVVDDPLLIEPYGNLSYYGVLRSMKKERFHMSVAFIPWNYKRSQQEIGKLVRDNRQYFSVVMHGNNHNHREFGLYGTHPLEEQITNIKQAIGRMDELKRLTSMPIEKVMVFPHEIAPENTLVELKRYNYLATVNSSNIPLGSPKPTDSLFWLRPFTVEFGNFLSIRRYSAELSYTGYDVVSPDSELAKLRPIIAMHSFLGNPLLFAAHEGFFAAGENAFAAFAKTVNDISPKVVWVSPGYMVNHLYLIARKSDYVFNVKMFGRSAEINNPTTSGKWFHIEKPEDFKVPIRSLTVNEISHEYHRNGTSILVKLFIPGGCSRTVAVTYENNLSRFDMSSSNVELGFGALRVASEFRDRVLARTPIGRSGIRLYYYLGQFAVVAFVVVCVVLVGLVMLVRWRRSHVRGNQSAQ